jgi:hypothetical protein
MDNNNVFPETNTMGEVGHTGGGLTKREFYAALILQAIVSKGDYDYGVAALRAVNYAEELIKKLGESND